MVEFFKFVDRYFRGWRGRLGLITLVLAVWLFVLSIVAHLNFAHFGYVFGSGHQFDLFAFSTEGLLWVTVWPVGDFVTHPGQFQYIPGWHVSDIPPYDYIGFGDIQDHWQSYGFRFTTGKNVNGRITEKKLLVPDVAVVAALISISALLLFSNARRRLRDNSFNRQ